MGHSSWAIDRSDLYASLGPSTHPHLRFSSFVKFLRSWTAEVDDFGDCTQDAIGHRNITTP